MKNAAKATAGPLWGQYDKTMDTKNTMDWKLVLNCRTRLIGDKHSQTAVLFVEANVMRQGQTSVEDIVSALRVVSPEIILNALEKALVMAAESFVKTHNETCPLVIFIIGFDSMVLIA